MRYTRLIGNDPVRFSWHYIRRVRQAAAGGMISSAEIAQVLRRFDSRITTSHITKWRADVPAFDRACNDSLEELNEAVANAAYQAAIDGDTAMMRYWLDRRSPAFMPKNKNVHEVGEQLDDILRRRAMSEKELYANGILIQKKPQALDDGDSYD